MSDKKNRELMFDIKHHSIRLFGAFCTTHEFRARRACEKCHEGISAIKCLINVISYTFFSILRFYALLNFLYPF
jgi:hypothetical protein